MFQKHRFYHDLPDYSDFFCDTCGDDLVMTDNPGQWVCISGDDHYLEFNNLSSCNSPNCPNLVLSKSGFFTSPEEKFCNDDSELKELYIQDGFGYEYEGLSCLEFYTRGIRKNRDQKGVHLTCIDCDGSFLIKGDGRLICRSCASEIDTKTSLFLSPIFTPDSFSDAVKKVKF